MTIEYDEINDTNKLLIANIVSKMEAIEELLSNIQTERATQETKWRNRETVLKNEKMKFTQEMRALRKAKVV